MRRVQPSTVIREELDRLLAGGGERERNIVSELMSLGLRYVTQQALEQEQTDFLGRGHYERASEKRGHRNGYEDATLRTAEGGVDVRVPSSGCCDRSSASTHLHRPKIAVPSARRGGQRENQPLWGSQSYRKVRPSIRTQGDDVVVCANVDQRNNIVRRPMRAFRSLRLQEREDVTLTRRLIRCGAGGD